MKIVNNAPKTTPVFKNIFYLCKCPPGLTYQMKVFSLLSLDRNLANFIKHKEKQTIHHLYGYWMHSAPNNHMGVGYCLFVLRLCESLYPDKRNMPHTFAFIDLHSWGGVGNDANYMNYYQIHFISESSVNLLDIRNRTKRKGNLSIEKDKVQLTFSSNKTELVKGVYTDYNNLAPVTVGGAPHVFSDNNRNLTSPMEDHLKPISDISLLKKGYYLITD